MELLQRAWHGADQWEQHRVPGAGFGKGTTALLSLPPRPPPLGRALEGVTWKGVEAFLALAGVKQVGLIVCWFDLLSFVWWDHS